MQEMRKREISKKADCFRANCKSSRYGIIDLFKECERLEYKLIRYPLGEHADIGFTLIKDSDTIIFTNTSMRLSREIFTLAHEIGHIVLHMNNGDTFIDNSITISGKSEDEKEKEANYFAACLLMPTKDVERFLEFEYVGAGASTLSAMDIARIMSEFNVSFDMALNRLENLEKISREERLRLDNDKNQTRVGNLLKSVGGNSKLNEVSNSIEIPYEYIQYVIYNYNRNAIPKKTLERVLQYYKLTIADVSDKLVNHDEDISDLDDLIGGLTD